MQRLSTYRSLPTLTRMRLLMTTPQPDPLLPRRRLSSHPSPVKREYIIHVPDFPEALEIRHQTKQAHIEGCTSLIENGQLSYFGVTMSAHPTQDSQPAVNGSIIVMEAESSEAVRQFLESDAYTKAGVWDVANAKIWPFRSG